jgi:hypothetical protein
VAVVVVSVEAFVLGVGLVFAAVFAVCDGPKTTTATITKDELFQMHKDMFIIRRMEITSDTEYKVGDGVWLTSLLEVSVAFCAVTSSCWVQDRRIRGFCHLYDGQVRCVVVFGSRNNACYLAHELSRRLVRRLCALQEAVAVGLQSALSKEDDVISTYRCHGLQYIRGDTVSAILAEMYDFSSGSSKGKGGSMHLYSRKNKFWGGAGPSPRLDCLPNAGLA